MSLRTGYQGRRRVFEPASLILELLTRFCNCLCFLQGMMCWVLVRLVMSANSAVISRHMGLLLKSHSSTQSGPVRLGSLSRDAQAATSPTQHTRCNAAGSVWDFSSEVRDQSRAVQCGSSAN